MELSQVIVRPVHRVEEERFQELMDLYHYLGALPKIGNTIWYVATNNDEWIALISYSVAALKSIPVNENFDRGEIEEG